MRRRATVITKSSSNAAQRPTSAAPAPPSIGLSIKRGHGAKPNKKRIKLFIRSWRPRPQRNKATSAPADLETFRPAPRTGSSNSRAQLPPWIPRSRSHPSTSVRRSNIVRLIARSGFEISAITSARTDFLILTRVPLRGGRNPPVFFHGPGIKRRNSSLVTQRQGT